MYHLRGPTIVGALIRVVFRTAGAVQESTGGREGVARGDTSCHQLCVLFDLSLSACRVRELVGRVGDSYDCKYAQKEHIGEKC